MQNNPLVGSLIGPVLKVPRAFQGGGWTEEGIAGYVHQDLRPRGELEVVVGEIAAARTPIKRAVERGEWRAERRAMEERFVVAAGFYLNI